MAIEIVMPALEMAQESALLVKWLKQEGEYVRKGEALMEIETDKATVEIESLGSGTLAEVTARDGDQVPVGKVIAVLIDPSSSTAHESAVRYAGPEEGDDKKTVSRHQPPSSQPVQPSGGQTLVSPKARRLARERGLDLSVLSPSAGGTVINTNEVLKMLQSQSAASAVVEYDVFPLKGKRKVIAERTQRSYQNAPHISLSRSIDMGEALAFIDRERAGGNPPNVSPNLTSMLLKATVDALVKHPRLNSHLVGEEIHEFRNVHLGVAVAVDDGLLVPVIRNAQAKSLAEIGDELEKLVARARNGRLQLDEMTGGTFTVSNLGMYGVEHFSAILNPPEVGILSLGCLFERAVNRQGIAEFHSFMEATINVDHRVIDGAVAATYLQTFKELLEHLQFDRKAS